MPTIVELGAKVKAKYPGQYDDLPDDELGRRVKAKFPDAYGDFTDTPPQRAQVAPGTPQGPGLAGMLPTIGGLAGGVGGGLLGGPPGALVGATVGGAAGGLGRQALTGQPLSLEQAAGEGNMQALSEITGLGLAKGVGLAARPLMQRALRPAAKAIQEYAANAARLQRMGIRTAPDLVQGVIEQRGTVGKVLGRGGSEQAAGLRRAAAAETEQLLTKATRAGTRFRVSGVLANLGDVIEEARLAGDTQALRQIRKMVLQFANTHARPLTPLRLKEIKQLMQTRANRVFGAINRGGVPSEIQTVKARVAHAIAKGAQEALEQIPGIAEREALTQRRIVTQAAIRRAESLPPRPASGGLIRGTISDVTTLGGLLDSPEIASRLSMLLSNPLLAAVLQQVPRAGAAVVRE